MKHAHTSNIIVLLEGALVTKNEANRPMVSTLKGIRMNMVALLHEMLYVLQDRITAKLPLIFPHTPLIPSFAG